MSQTYSATLASLATAACIHTGPPAAVAQSGPPLVPEHVTLNGAAQAAINASWLTADEQRQRRIFHGTWDDRDLVTAEIRATVAIAAWRLDDPALDAPGVSAGIRAEANLLRGDLVHAIDLLHGDTSMRGARIRAEAYAALGDNRRAAEAAETPIARLATEAIDSAAEVTEAVKTLMVLARIQGQPARDYQAMMALLGRAHQELDRLYWPAKLAEARLLASKDNESEAVVALHETLRLNPRVSEAWFQLGRIGLRRFDFDSTELAIGKLRKLNSLHPLATLLEAETRLIRDDPDGAAAVIEPLLARLPRLRPALALHAAAEALRFDEDALERALGRYEQLSPGSAEAYAVVGRHLSLNRQYGQAARLLGEAIRRQPAWPVPQIELGLMELQSGRDDEARRVLTRVAELDPFNRRAANSLRLLEELATYETVESEHFVIRYKPGIDKVLVDLMVDPLERLHVDVSARFRHEPDRKTTIEVLPDHVRFGVRITGMPWIHTIAASTGPVIAMEVPRQGAPQKHQGTFDWPRVIRHEYTHTITLSQTRNRIPHWLTEAAAVDMEEAPRDYNTCEMLADAYHTGRLFDFDELKWAFVRPKRRGDRALAYAQGHWMLQFMNERYGESSLVRLLALYFDGVREQQAMLEALGVPRERFMEEFRTWAARDVASWGLNPQPGLEELVDELRWADPELAEAMEQSRQARLDAIAELIERRVGAPASARGHEPFTSDRWPELIRPRVAIDDETLAVWLDERPDHPDLLELALRRRLRDREEPDAELLDLLDRYSRARPVDPFPHKQLARIWLDSPTPQRAVPHLEALDIREQKTPIFAFELARQYRQAGDTERALAKITRACMIDPYDADWRELAAPIAIEAGRLDLARIHIEALTLIEPDRPHHVRRFEAIERLIAERSPAALQR